MMSFPRALALVLLLPVAPLATAPAAADQGNPFTFRAKLRSYDFTRQNASATAPSVNQASWNNAIDVHADYHLRNGWYAGGTYFYANPFNGGPANTKPDETLPGFGLSTLYEAYVGYSNNRFAAKLGNQIFNSAWAGPVDTRVKPAAFQGIDASYSLPHGWTIEGADMWRFEPRTSSAFIRGTLITTYPAGNNGLAPNIYIPGGNGVATSGFVYGRIGNTSKDGRDFFNISGYDVSNVVSIGWLDAKHYFSRNRLQPYLWVQGGVERNNGATFVGKIDSSLLGVQVGANASRDVVVSASYVETPWRSDTIALPKGDTCRANAQLNVKNGTTLAYFLPLNAGQCQANANGTTTIYYGGWASPYTDNYATNPVFTTAISQGMTDRRAAGESWRLAATYTSRDNRVVLIAGNAWFNYGNGAIAQRTTEFNLDGTYRFSKVRSTLYHGLQLRYRYADRSYSNTALVGGQPLFKYNRAMLEYDF